MPPTAARRAAPRLTDMSSGTGRTAAGRRFAVWPMRQLLRLAAACLPLACAAPAPEAASHDEHGEHGEVHEHADEPAHAGLPAKLRLEPDVLAAAGVQWAPVRRQPLAPSVWVAGEVQADPDRTMQVAARVAGMVEEVLFREGDRVEAGQVLAKIRAPGLGGLRADQASLVARAASAKANHERLEVLSQRNMASQQELAAARAESEALHAEARAAGQRLQALGLASDGRSSVFSLRAPLAGVVTQRGVVVGQAVVAEDMVATVVDLDQVWFVARVFEHTLSRIEIGAAAEVALNAFPKDRFLGTVAYIAPQVDPGARTLVARIPLDNPGHRIRLGLFGAASVAVPDQEGRPAGAPVLAVPREAVTEVGGEPAVFVRHPDGDFELHAVVLGGAAPGVVEVLSGLREGEDVVVRGAFTLKSVLLKHTFAEEEH